jgi:hypothetical protein
MQAVALQQPGGRPPAALASPAAAPAPLVAGAGRDARPCGWPTAGACSRELQPGAVSIPLPPGPGFGAGTAELRAAALLEQGAVHRVAAQLLHVAAIAQGHPVGGEGLALAVWSRSATTTSRG